MRFLADESCDFAVVRALRAEGHAVKKDFGQLVFAERRATGGVIFIRFPVAFRAELPRAVCRLVEQRGEKLVGSFVVIQPGRIRVAHRPRGGA